jgi:parallel beta-helix repeat protein
MAAFRAVMFLLLLLSLVGSGAAATTYTVCSAGCDHTTIQAAVNAASAGDTVYVYNGSYTENVDIATAHLTIEGEGSDVVTVTAASSADHVFYVQADYVNISGFNVTGATNSNKAGIYAYSVQHCNISDNIILINAIGICLYTATNNTLTNNIASNNAYGIIVTFSNNNNILINNTANSNSYAGITLQSSDSNSLTNNTADLNDVINIWLSSSSNCILTNNIASDGYSGIQLSMWSDNNILINNTANSNGYAGITMYSSDSNSFTNNIADLNYRGAHLYGSCDNIFDNHTSTNSTQYDYYSWYTSLNNTLLNCDLLSSTSMMNDSTSQWIIKYTTSNITKYSDTTINQTISPTNVSTTIEPTLDDYAITMDTLDDFSATTDVSTANLQLVEFASGGHSEFAVSSAQHATVTTFNLGTFTPGQTVQLKRNNLGVTCARAGVAGIATFIYSGGFSDHEFETDPVGLYVHLNDTQNYTFTNDSYDAAAFTSQVTITSAGSPACAVSIEMPLITDSAYIKLGYNITNITTGFTVTNKSGWAAVNFTVTENTTVRIMPSEAAKTSNLPAVVVGGIGAVTVIIYLVRRRRR